MTLLDDARRLAESKVTRDGTVWCHFCGDMIEDPSSYDPPLPHSEQHDPDCPWLSMPRIVAALEAANQTVAILHRADAALSTLRDVANRDVMTPEDVDVAAVATLRADIQALVAALRGETVTA